jgi:basic membrane lipoprotein Med (substrate-binding protein (PBP1-ABC) superfamily)
MKIASRRVAALATIAGALLLAACSGADSAARGRSSADSTFQVALLTPGPISDHSWNAGAYQGLLRIRDSLGAHISHIQVKTPADFEENFRQYGAQHYDLVFGHGFEFQDAASRVGPEFPNTVYITTSGNRFGKNVAPMVFGFEEPSYLAGVLAGSLTKSKVIGMIGGTQLPPVASSFLAFEAGVHSVDPKIKVLTSYIGSWDDASAGKEQAIAQIQRGADFIFQNGDAAGLGVFQAAREAKNVYVFGTNSNQNAVAPKVIIASVVIDLPHAFLTVARQVKEGHFQSKIIYLGTSTGVVKLVLNPELESLVPRTLQTKLDSVRDAIEAGTVKPPRLEFVDTIPTH